MNCDKCGKPLSCIEWGLSRKYLGRGTETAYCTQDLAEYLGTTAEDLAHMVKVFRKQGCMLFPPWDPAEEDSADKEKTL